jgi:hypothetical protein
VISALPPASTITQRVASVHETDSGVPAASSGVDDQVTGAEIALAVAKTVPSLATATHAAELLHEIAVSDEDVRCVIGQDPDVGAVDASTLPELSTATQKPLVGHEMPLRCTVPSIITAVQELWTVGVELETTFPWLSVAKHAVALGQETPVSGVAASTLADVQWPVGSAAVKTLLALPPTATQSVPCGQESAAGETSPAAPLKSHPPAAGVVLVKMPPALSTPTHSAVEGHVSATGVLAEPVAAGALHAGAGSDATAGTAAQHTAAIAAAAMIIRRGVSIVPIVTTRSLFPLSLYP